MVQLDFVLLGIVTMATGYWYCKRGNGNAAAAAPVPAATFAENYEIL
jgi:hypothetical protein